MEGFCQRLWNGDWDKNKFMQIMYISTYHMHFIDMYNAYIVLYLKSTSDLLSGFNKLDSLLKVSVF
jgi:hypothetical protein